MLCDRYYYHRLNDKNQFLYRMILKAAYDFVPIISCRNQQQYSRDDLTAINNAIVLDNPYLFYYSGHMKTKNRGLSDIEIELSFDFSQEKCKDLQDKLNTRAMAFFKSAKLEGRSEEERVRAIHDMLVSTVVYDMDCIESHSTEGSEEEKYAHSILGVLLNKKAVCDGIAKTYKYLLNAINIGSIVVLGSADSSLISGADLDHAWNIVKIEGENYYSDITWDIAESKDGFICYDYYNLTELQIRKDHYGFDGFPICNSLKYNYFFMMSTIMYSERMLMEYIDRCIEKRSKELYFCLGFECVFMEVLNRIQEHVLERLSYVGRTEIIQYYYRDKQKIIRIKFSSEMPIHL